MEQVRKWKVILTAAALFCVPGVALAVDVDLDGLDDAWEIYWFSGTGEDGSGDPDGDNLLNIGEYLSGTDPTAADTDSDGLDDRFNYGLDGYWSFDDTYPAWPGERGAMGSAASGWLAPSAGDANVLGFEFFYPDAVLGYSIGYYYSDPSNIEIGEPADESYPLDGATDWTVSLWVRMDYAAPTNMLFSTKTTTVPQLGAYSDSSGNLKIYTEGVVQTLAAPDLTPGGWHHVTFIRDVGADEIRVRINNQSAGAVPAAAVGSLPYQLDDLSLMIASSEVNGTNYSIMGDVDEFRIYRRILGEAEIAEIYQQGVAGGNAAQFWTFDYLSANPSAGAGDQDGDGFSNLVEAAAGSNALDANSVPKVIDGRFRVYTKL